MPTPQRDEELEGTYYINDTTVHIITGGYQPSQLILDGSGRYVLNEDYVPITKPPLEPGPVFEGWRELGMDEPVKEGDYLCDFAKNLRPDADPHTVTTRHAISLPNARDYLSAMVWGWEARTSWRIYRRTGPRRLPLNKIHSEPVPLP